MECIQHSMFSISKKNNFVASFLFVGYPNSDVPYVKQEE